MKAKCVSSLISGVIALLLFTSCLDGFKKKTAVEFIHPDLYLERGKYTESKGVGHVKM
ncbi:hypothetical protein [Formosa sediminum]|uniref:hypothetical protein n=1 Tax=Formosa sediminum TaxID=2594004 RepID=UPI00163D5A22|nr:hypothetical protein [Formosa sediminum]